MMKYVKLPGRIGAFLAVVVLCPASLRAAEKPIDTANSSLTIHVGKAGFFSVAGHEHTVTAPIREGAIDPSGEGRVWFAVDAAKLTVAPEKDQAAVQADMQKKVLESDRFPEIRFQSTAIRKLGEGKWTVEGGLTLHGQTRPVAATVHREGERYTGKSVIKQSEFGIEPISVAGGTVKVKNELTVEFSIRPRR